MSSKSRQRPSSEKAKVKLPFGTYGEFTEETLRRAKLSVAERARAQEMLEVQEAFLQILDTLSYPVDPEGHVHDLNHMKPSLIAIAWTMALAGMRMSGKPHIKKRYFTGGGMYADAHTWVDVRKSDDARADLRPDDRADDQKLPPDTRRLAAIRDGEEASVPDQAWKTKAIVEHVYEPRPED